MILMENCEGKENKYLKLLNDIFLRAFQTSAFSTVCSVLRVGGMSDANWDPFEESRDAFEDFNWILEISGKKRTNRCQARVALLMYCQLVEMTAPHEILINLLRCVNGEHYIIAPFNHLGRSKKGTPFSYVPPSAKVKFRYICEKAKEVNENSLITSINSVYYDYIRNAFSHSDYILTDEYFRYTEGGLAQQIELSKLNEIIAECFDFYSAFMTLHRHWLQQLSKINKFHKWPQYEVLELLSDDSGLYGFHLHFSNGSKATYSRRRSGIDAINILFEEDKGINFMCGSIDELEPQWKINGVPVDDWDTLE